MYKCNASFRFSHNNFPTGTDMAGLRSLLFSAILWSIDSVFAGTIDRYAVVSQYNPVRNASNDTTPMQVGNGGFAFGADVTGLQTFLPWAIMSDWGWKNDTLPVNRTTEDVLDYEGVEWWNHDRLVQYEFGGEAEIQQWLIANPNRVNLGRIGLAFYDTQGAALNVSETDLSNKTQTLDLWSGTITSSFLWNGEDVTIGTAVHQELDVVGLSITSNLLQTGQLGVFLDFPWCDGTNKFSAPFVGVFNETSLHNTTLSQSGNQTIIAHSYDSLNATTFYTVVAGNGFNVTRVSPETHRYTIMPQSSTTSDSFQLSILYTPNQTEVTLPSISEIYASSTQTWEDYWTQSGFVDVLTGSTDVRAIELQRRIVLSRYLMRVNEAGDLPPQESGLVNDGWYGKFHMEMYWWHAAHWTLWNNWSLLSRSLSVYSKFLQTSIWRSVDQQGWTAGSARWGKMSDPTGRSAPGQINELLIWQQVHPLMFAEYQYRSVAGQDEDTVNRVLEQWKDVVVATANWMVDFAWWNTSTSVYDLGPPMYVVAEDTAPNVTINPAFELAYWDLGLGIAKSWVERLNETAPSNWTTVREQLAPLPIENGTYAVYEGIPSNFWTDSAYTSDHPALVGLYGWLPPTQFLNLTTFNETQSKLWETWTFDECWGWDFPMLALAAARTGNTEKAVEWLLDDLFQFDDVGMPIGGARVPTPYFPGSGGLLYAVAFMAGGWDGSVGNAPGFPTDGWVVRSEGLSKAM